MTGGTQKDDKAPQYRLNVDITKNYVINYRFISLRFKFKPFLYAAFSASHDSKRWA